MTEFKFQPLAPIPYETLIAGGPELSFIRPDGPSRCTWKPGSDLKSAPHLFQSHQERPKILPNVLHAVGNTPLIQLNKIPSSFGIKCKMYAKCEFLNPAGSVKDRIAIRMVEDAERQGLLQPGCTIIEPSSGNTGLGLAMAAAVKGYNCIIVMPLKMSNEKVDTLRALGANIVRTPTSASFDSPEGLMAVAQKICRETPNSIILDQYRNSFNPISHYEHTAQEILTQCDGKIDAVVCGAGTGGTITGIGRKIKDTCPSCKVIAADPLGSSLSYPEDLNKTNISFYEVEGIGYDFIPTVLDRSVVDMWVKTNDKDSLTMARRLIKEEGLLCGGSSGSAMCVAIEVAKSMREDQRLVVILPDGMRNYMSKFINDSWMIIRDFKNIEELENLWWAKVQVNCLPLKKPTLISSSAKFVTALKQMKDVGCDYVFVQKEKKILGFISKSKILSSITNSKINLEDEVEKFVEPVRTVMGSTPLGKISVILQRENLVLVDVSEASDVNEGDCDLNKKYTDTDSLLEFISNSTA